MARRPQAGFTLLEMMVVITVMGTMAALLAPGVGEFLADARGAAASEDLVRLSRHIRSRTQQSGLAHLLVFSSRSDDAGGLGHVRVYEGMNNHCRQTPWTQALNGTVAQGQAPVDELNLGLAQYNPPLGGNSSASVSDTNRQVIRLTAESVTTADVATSMESVVLCYEPSGATWQGTSDGSVVGYGFARQTLRLRFTVARSVNSEARGRSRPVTFQPGGIARFSF